ncbi:VPS13B [Lepeophtheirus salmonis]|uniref:VPS13B n=1 Tax=Lepeophtheirus salmonis TaxID=72036 RepID=A0A7R8D8D8_LEPSM|nr:VPS13B [Lepeophtheirus salmonis]CAF3034548.1 VPS13B [Lepeophtheirus salmonis]
MFKLESYITPIILSYVEKYAKNLKAERSQFSLWGGDAVFSNLDLRLDVLERELNIPFTFVSGHIHELHIHVPWTRLHADPIVITINTIECIPPPGYVQSLINKIISNVSIVCNNLILKYVEEDIVLSLNTRSVKLSSCDDNWDPSFIELSLPNLILRKIIDVSDLTICLDKRNASGKIECYQEPLLYRCSLKVHVAWIYDSLNAKIPRISRFEIRCPKLEFSITETQMPMLLRLFHLAMALYFGKLNPTDSHQSAIGSKEYEESENSANLDNVGGDSWSGWAWNVGSTVGTALLPIYWEDEDEEELKMHKGLSKFNRVLHLGFYVDHASVDLKLTEISKEKRFFGTTSHKQSFTPYCKFGFHGIFGAVSVKGINSVNVRGGINAFETLPLGNCPCGVDEKDREDFYIIGGPNYEEHEDKKGSLYLSGSLFDKDRGDESGIPIEKRRNYDIVWDAHMDEVTEEIMLERSSAFALDYLYYWEIPNDWSSEQLSEISTDFEYSNFIRKSIISGRIWPFLMLCFHGNPFIAEETSKLESSLEEEIDLIQNGSIPVRVYQITAIQPCFVISAINHSHNNKQGKPQLTEFVLPSAKCSMGYIDLTYTTPMYPFRCAKTISLINEPRLGLLHSSIYASANANLLDVSIHLCHGERSVTLLQPSKLKGGFKRLLFSKYWKKDTLPHWEITFEVNSFKFRFTKPQILLLTYILSKGILVHFEKEALSVIVKDSLTKKLCSIVISISGTKLIAARTINVSSLQLVIDEIGINLLPSDSNLGSIPILSREKGNEDFNKTSPGRASINSGSPSLFVLQFPNDHKNQFFNDTPPIVYCNIAEFYINFDPTLDENKNIYFLDPNHLSCTLDLKSNEDNRLNLCMHIDASNSFKFRIDSDFLLAFTDVMNCFISCLRTMCPLKIEEEECFDENESSYTPEPISSIRSQSGLFDSGKLIDESILSSSNVSSNTVIKESNSEICLTHWFQCTIPSISINFHPMNEEDSILNLEMEDITASLDVQPHYTKLKSRIIQQMEIRFKFYHIPAYFESANFKTQGVFNFTFVRALITNAKWKSFLKKSKTLINNEDEYYDIDDPRYLSEFILNQVQLTLHFAQRLYQRGAPAERKKNTSYPIDLWINNNTLPLFHFKGKSIRIFCRNNNNLIGSDFQDTVLFHIESINMSSNVENALSRLLIRPDLYYLAEQCEVLSEIGINFVEKSRKNSDIVLKTMEENPALEWNTSELNRQEDNDDEPFFYPILKQFNLQITYAPAIVYYSSNMSKKLKSRLIAGHSLEINAVSNINVYASLDQIRLCRGITEDIQKSFTSLLMQKKDSEASASSDCSHITDSGCESVISLSHTRYKHLKFVPLEVLITGSSISLSLYQLRKGEHDSNRKTKSREVRYKNRKRDIIKEQSLIDDGNQCLELPPLNLSNPSNDESLINEKNQMNNEDSFQLNPLLFVALSQPHVFISITRSSQKLELSFYDISLNSSSNEDFYIITKDKHSLPSEAVFLNHWIETKPGDADPLSGIPPALFTATISDFFISSPKLSISIDRPLKLNIDEQNFSRGSEILKQLYQSLNLKPSPSQYSSKSSSFSIIHLLRLSKIIISTKQILIAHPINHIYAEFFVGLSSLDIQVNSQEYEASQIEVDFNNVSIRTKLRDITHRFLNPWSFSISSDLTWAKWKEEPIVYLNLSSKSIEIDMGPNTVLSILLAVNYYCQHYTSWKGELDNFSSLSSNSESKTFRKSPSPEQHYSDDLRAGAFKYITNVGTKASDIRPYQVVFTPRALTWRYPQPRALTGTTIYPVPLLAASELGRQASGPDNQVKNNIFHF